MADLASKKKAQDVVALDMRKVSTFCDYFIICSGSSHRMVKAIGEEIKEGLEREGILADHIEGIEEETRWILIDYGDVVIHIFYEEARSFYNLEWLWSDAKRLKLKIGSAPNF